MALLLEATVPHKCLGSAVAQGETAAKVTEKGLWQRVRVPPGLASGHWTCSLHTRASACGGKAQLTAAFNFLII